MKKTRKPLLWPLSLLSFQARSLLCAGGEYFAFTAPTRSEGAPAAAAPACVSRAKSLSDSENERVAGKLEGDSLGLQTPPYLLGKQFAKPVRQKASPSATDAAKAEAARRVPVLASLIQQVRSVQGRVGIPKASNPSDSSLPRGVQG